MASSSSSTSLGEKTKEEKARECVRKYRIKEKDRVESLQARKESLTKEFDQFRLKVMGAHAKNKTIAQIAGTINQYNPGAADHQAMKNIMKSVNDPAWKQYDPAKSWKQNNMK